jgi:hypothetical protein
MEAGSMIVWLCQRVSGVFNAGAQNTQSLAWDHCNQAEQPTETNLLHHVRSDSAIRPNGVHTSNGTVAHASNGTVAHASNGTVAHTSNGTVAHASNGTGARTHRRTKVWTPRTPWSARICCVTLLETQSTCCRAASASGAAGTAACP